MPALDHRSLASHVDQWLLGATITSALGLALQITHPLQERTTAPPFVNWACGLALILGLLRFFSQGRRDERWIALSCLFGVLAFLGFCEPWSIDGPGEFASRTGRFLSTTHIGVPVIALIEAWLCLGLGLICGRAVLLCLRTEGPWQRGSAWLVGLVVGVFGAHGVMGYASGNSSLLLP